MKIMRFSLKLTPSAIRLLILAFALVLWELSGRLNWVHRTFLAPPSEVITTLVRVLVSPGSIGPLPRESLHLYSNLQLTLIEIVVAYAFVSLLGLLLGFAIGEVKVLGETLEPLMVAVFAIPNVVLLPSILLLFGFGVASKIVFGVILGFFPVVSNTVAGLRQVEKPLLVTAQSMGANNLQLHAKVIIPAASVAIISGLKQGLSLTIIGVIAAELVSSPTGLGYLMNYSASFFYTPELFSLVMIALAISLSGLWIFGLLEKRLKR